VIPVGVSTIKATIPIINSGAVSPSACAIPIIVPVNMPGIAKGKTWWVIVCTLDAPMPSAASRIDGGTDFIAARLEIIMVGNVIKVNTKPPTKGTDLGKPKKLMNIAKPSKPKITDGTAAKLLILTSIKSVSLFLGANSSK